MFICKAIVKHVYHLKGDNISGLVFLDFKKDFDLVNQKVLLEKIGLQSTPDNSNLQAKSKNVRVIGSSKKIPGSKKTKNSFYCTVNISITFNCIEMISEN